jgi:hypothetical protein
MITNARFHRWRDAQGLANYGSQFSYRNKWAGDLISKEEKPSVL